MPNQITTGVKITVDASDIQNKFTKSVDQLNASLSKNQKALGLVYNEQGLLTNALGQTVDGLSQSAIKLGQYVDVLGRVRTYQDGFVDGLTKTQIEMGMYADEIGNVYNKLGELVGQTEKARKAQEAETQAAARAAQEQADNAVKLQDGMAKTADAVSKVAGQVAIFQGLMQATGASSTKAGAAIAQTAQALSVAAGSFKATTELVKSLSETLKVAPSLFVSTTQAAQAAAPALAAVGTEAKAAGVAIAGIGGPITIAISAVAALAAGLASLNASKVETDLLSQSFEDLEAKARAAGTTIKSLGDALKVGAFASASTDIERASLRFLDAKETLDRARADLDAYKKEVAAFNESRKYATGANLGAGPNIKDFGDAANFAEADAEWKNAIADYNDMAKRYVDAARANQQTEVDKINEQKKAYNALLKVAEKIGDAQNADLFKKEIDRLDGQIIAAKEKDLQLERRKIAEAEKQAQDAAKQAEIERIKTVENAGALEYIRQAQAAQKSAAASLENYAATISKWNNLVAVGTMTAEELAQAEAGLTSKIRDNLAKELDVVFDATKETSNAMDKLSKALNDGIITQEQYNTATEQLKAVADKEAAAQAEKAKEQAERDKQSKRNNLGVDALLESLKSPVVKYRETLDKIADALTENAINLTEADALRAQAADVYLKTLKADVDKLEATQSDTENAQTAQRQKNGELARSMSAGSEDLYLAQVRNATSSYQSNMTAATQAIQATTASMLQTSQMSMQYLQMLVDNQGAGVAVWG